ncbi:hypothetical protein F5Y05DRAFT_109185 [Hypoxylon sp. FL0543]|nr:hypothetical protein F5Y05DRAFT_109185 [Hypoxylon sp. FL0543]
MLSIPSLPEKPFRLYVKIPIDLLNYFDPSTSFEPTDSIISTQSKAREAFAELFKEIGNQLNIESKPRLQIYWPKPGRTSGSPDIASNFSSLAYMFDHNISGVPKPEVLILIATMEDRGGLGFQLVEADARERSRVNIIVGY